MKISRQEWDSIGKYNHAAKWLRPFCSYSLIQESDKFKREQRIPWVIYLILFIPVHILQALWCMWDGGLREFEFADRYLGGDYITTSNPAYEIAKEIWERG